MQQEDYIQELIEQLKVINPYMIILFGSYAYGTPNADSDIDMLVITNDDFIPKNYNEQLEYCLSVRKLIRKTARKVPVDLLIYSKPMFDKFKALESSFSKEILQKGKKLYESNN